MLLQLGDQVSRDLVIDIGFDQGEIVCEQFGRDLNQSARSGPSSQLGDHLLKRVQPLFDVGWFDETSERGGVSPPILGCLPARRFNGEPGG